MVLDKLINNLHQPQLLFLDLELIMIAKFIKEVQNLFTINH